MTIYIPDFVIYLIAVTATILVIMKLKQYENERIEALRAVSYTHLTLPTTPYV